MILRLSPSRYLILWFSPFCFVSKERPLDFKYFCSRSVQEFFTVFELFRKVNFTGWPKNAFIGPLSEEIKKYILPKEYFKQLLFDNASKYFGFLSYKRSKTFTDPSNPQLRYNWPNLRYHLKELVNVNNFCSISFHKILMNQS